MRGETTSTLPHYITGDEPTPPPDEAIVRWLSRIATDWKAIKPKFGQFSHIKKYYDCFLSLLSSTPAMTKATTRDIVLGRLKDAVKNKKIIVGAGAGNKQILYLKLSACDILTSLSGIGLSAKSVEAGGADLIIVYNSGRFRMAGRGSLAGLMPYGDANQVVLEMVPPHS
jgi:hypothetical protein